MADLDAKVDELKAFDTDGEATAIGEEMLRLEAKVVTTLAEFTRR